MESLADWSSRNGSEDDGIIIFMKHIRDRGGRFYAPEGCSCNACKLAEKLYKTGVLSRQYGDGEIIYRALTYLDSQFELEMWKLNNANPTEV